MISRKFMLAKRHGAARFVACLVGVAVGALSAGQVEAWGRGGVIDRVVDGMGGMLERSSVQQVPAAGSIEVAFSPNGGSEGLVLKLIDSANSEIHVLAYSFTSAPVVSALIRAHKRGVRVAVVADKKNNTSDDRSGKSRAALSALSSAGVDVRLIAAYPIHHDKVMVADRQHVELGSFNYSDAAARRNSENVLVNWNNPALASVYLKHFQRNYAQSEAFTLAY